MMGLLAVVLIAASCGDSLLPGTTEFVIHIDSVTGPTAVSGGVAFESRLWGPVGPDGCWSFKELRTTRVPAQVDVTVIGQHVQDAGIACTEMPVGLNGVVLRVDPIIPSSFSIVVHQPDGSTLMRRVLGE